MSSGFDPNRSGLSSRAADREARLRQVADARRQAKGVGYDDYEPPAPSRLRALIQRLVRRDRSERHGPRTRYR